MIRRLKNLIKAALATIRHRIAKKPEDPAKQGVTRILLAGHDLKFIQPVIDYFENSSRWDVRTDITRQIAVDTTVERLELLDWADVIFCEWGMANSVWYSRHKRKEQTLIVRVHLQEHATEYLHHIEPKKLDGIIAIAPLWQERFAQKLALPIERVSLIFNAISIRAVQDRSSSVDRNFKIGLVGVVPKRKRLDMALDIFERLYKANRKYTLHIKGALPFGYPWMFEDAWAEESEYYHQCFQRIQTAEWCNSVFFDGQGNDMPEWYSSMGWILSVSDFEGSHQAVAEGMAYGCTPVIRDWDGAEQLYVTEPIFDNVDAMANYILAGRTDESVVHSQEFALANFEASHVSQQIERLICDTRGE